MAVLIIAIIGMTVTGEAGTKRYTMNPPSGKKLYDTTSYSIRSTIEASQVDQIVYNREVGADTLIYSIIPADSVSVTNIIMKRYVRGVL